jgi:Na+/melibiose symporter-like transporter
MVFYGMGSISNSVKTRGLSTFLMVFYNQVMGLPAAWVGLGTAMALIFDALVDPAVGQISDNTRSRLGRRHPYMYAAAGACWPRTATSRTAWPARRSSSSPS